MARVTATHGGHRGRRGQGARGGRLRATVRGGRRLYGPGQSVRNSTSGPQNGPRARLPIYRVAR